MKQSFEVIYFEFTAPLHISNARADDYGVSEKTIHSDTIHAAIMQSWAILGKTEWIKAIPDFTISSLFPFTPKLKTNEMVHFFAKPFLKPNAGKSEVRTEDAKKFKKIKYVDIPHFESYISNKEVASTTDSIQDSYQTFDAIDKDFMTSDVQPRIKRPRDEQQDSKPFYTERIFFKKGSGMFCLVQYENESIRKQVKAALNLLAENGIGTDRAVGNGQFKVSFGKIDIEIAENTNYAMNMSLFCPESKSNLAEILEDKNVKYEIIKRGGWLSEPHNKLRKRSIYMFKEGSVFRINAAKPFSKGKTVDLLPALPSKIENPIYRVGKALFLPVKL
ncbi:type III-A CRISPR-associated RAMP protein Csm4 [Arcicella sp. LKC2W]|uniref:type III-A CRISPR-associated RAMP protein Csm4 n=1 Tax=Arcicella sp. LKC2W TaxID=2984198 RepID=UPI002B1EE8E4|nr:type III-A CRISPR-associated RAMP protein Csm4 [Arcicella sp. LKC2W]MEA5461606.1 type III-A CRISPR-associated RAMP protein Csm4 [Arcicella sp. LKC2W]